MTPVLSPSPFGEAKTLVIKLGSAVLTTAQGSIDIHVMRDLCDTVAGLVKDGRNVIVVTSGAVALGRGALKLTRKSKTIPEKQALAAIGQGRLMQIYSDGFQKHGITVGQMLLTRGDMEDRRRFLNARYTLEELLKRRCVPIINENDTVTVDELKFGDNDGLAALVAVKMNADALIILSDVEGLYNANPKTTRNAQLLEQVDKITPTLIAELCPQPGAGAVGSGGMASKVRAARLATNAGVCVAIAQGKTRGQIASIISGNFQGTFFPASMRRHSQRALWIMSGSASRGRRLHIDEGARAAIITNKKSLLPAGVQKIEGTFMPGDVVDVVDPSGHVIARGIVNYSSAEMERIQGHKSSDIEEILGYRSADEAIHRDDLVVGESV
jgi:glutamate 5-kinase